MDAETVATVAADEHRSPGLLLGRGDPAMNPQEMDLPAVEGILLSSASEDAKGLYEAIWELNAKFPSEPLGRKYDVASTALIDLHTRGLIQFEKVSTSPGEKRVEEISALDVRATLMNPVSWYPEYDGFQVVFVCTEAGMASYFGKPAR